ncbi:hypothetical protein VTO73DRAFT_14222 [Trametes versicolor]
MAPNSHPLQTVFRTPDAGLIRNKDGLCRNCDKKPARGEHFRKCAGCQLALYCSDACQQEDRSRHKPQCDFLQESAEEIRELQADANEEELAYLEEKLALRSRLRDYAEAHRLSFRFIASAQLFLAGAASTPLADDPKVLVVPLRPHAPDGTSALDPARAFTAGKTMLLPLARVLEDSAKSGTRLSEAYAASAGYRARLAATEAAGNPWFTGLLPVLYRAAPGVTTMEFFPQCRPDAPFRGAVTTASERQQITYYSRFIELGVLLRPDPGVSGDTAYVPGYLKRAGSRWKWTPLFTGFPNDPQWQRTPPAERQKLLEMKLEQARHA